MKRREEKRRKEKRSEERWREGERERERDEGEAGDGKKGIRRYHSTTMIWKMNILVFKVLFK